MRSETMRHKFAAFADLGSTVMAPAVVALAVAASAVSSGDAHAQTDVAASAAVALSANVGASCKIVDFDASDELVDFGDVTDVTGYVFAEESVDFAVLCTDSSRSRLTFSSAGDGFMTLDGAATTSAQQRIAYMIFAEFAAVGGGFDGGLWAAGGESYRRIRATGESRELNSRSLQVRLNFRAEGGKDQSGFRYVAGDYLDSLVVRVTPTG